MLLKLYSFRLILILIFILYSLGIKNVMQYPFKRIMYNNKRFNKDLQNSPISVQLTLGLNSGSHECLFAPLTNRPLSLGGGRLSVRLRTLTHLTSKSIFRTASSSDISITTFSNDSCEWLTLEIFLLKEKWQVTLNEHTWRRLILLIRYFKVIITWWEGMWAEYLF